MVLADPADRRLVVATECPTCGAPLDFAEGSNAVRCDHCGATLLVTGRRQVLSYYLPPRIELREAVARVQAACHEHGRRMRIGRVERYFLPYYRLTGQDLRWESGERAHAAPEATLAAALTEAGFGFGVPHDALDRRLPPSELQDRYVDKSFAACAAVAWGPYSLGVRASVLRLQLYHAQTLAGLGRVVAPDVEPAAARAQGRKTMGVSSKIVYRQVLGEQLSVIYFPFCAIELTEGDARVGGGRDVTAGGASVSDADASAPPEPDSQGARMAIVDGISGSVVTLDADARLAEALGRVPTDEPETVGFRPLVCPNCGWDLPVRPDDAVLYCGACARAYQIDGRELRPVSFTVATPAAAARQGVKYLPVWMLRGGAERHGATQFLVPAFRFRRLKILVDLTRDMSRRARTYEATTAGEHELYGCYYDADDAGRLAEVAYPGLTLDVDRAIGELAAHPLAFAEQHLVWLPFRREAGALREPFTGRAVDERLLL